MAKPKAAPNVTAQPAAKTLEAFSKRKPNKDGFIPAGQETVFDPDRQAFVPRGSLPRKK